MISSVLVANRGEIACRIFRTCADLGIRTVAVHSDADGTALHTRVADTAVRLPGAAPADTYLRGDLIVKAALAAGAEAVHPGYGFLSENPGFARAVLDAGLLWIGPAPEAIEAMASKTRAKRLLGLAPLEEVTEADLPVLVKAAAGGGGRGMRIVRRLDELPAALDSARAEAASAFGDGEVFVEPYLEHGRHVEVQILADSHGTVWPLGTRDCSLQRRHQKVIEEAPAPGLTQGLAEELRTLAVHAARAVSYTGAGTVEFLVADGRAHFLEMNTRLQVEHPVTEAVFGLDLVAEQIRVAEGHALDPEPPRARGTRSRPASTPRTPPTTGRPRPAPLHRLAVPAGVRLDTGYTDGDTIGVHYDPMLAKVVAHAPTRAEAIRRLAGALESAAIHGPVTNRDLLVRSLRHEEFTAARMDTGFYDRHLGALTEPVHDPLAPLAAALADAHGRSPLRRLAQRPLAAAGEAVRDGRRGARGPLPAHPGRPRGRRGPGGARRRASRRTRSGRSPAQVRGGPVRRPGPRGRRPPHRPAPLPRPDRTARTGFPARADAGHGRPRRRGPGRRGDGPGRSGTHLAGGDEDAAPDLGADSRNTHRPARRARTASGAGHGAGSSAGNPFLGAS